MTQTNRPFGALLTAMVTPMHADGEIDFAATQALARFLGCRRGRRGRRALLHLDWWGHG